MSDGDGRWKGEAHRRQRRKNVALMLALIAFALLMYLVTIVRMGGNVMKGF
jgi:Flp pilus assembly protein TadG